VIRTTAAERKKVVELANGGALSLYSRALPLCFAGDKSAAANKHSKISSCMRASENKKRSAVGVGVGAWCCTAAFSEYI